MSHISEISLEFKDLDCIDAACKELGLELVRGKTSYKWWGKWMKDSPLPPGVKEEDLGKCDHAIRIPGNSKAYEIGVCKLANGNYSLRWDFWQGGYGMQDKVGANAGKLSQLYGVHVAAKAARKQGYSVQRRQLQDGRIQLMCSR